MNCFEKKIFCIVFSIFILSTLWGCQKQPTDKIVTSKNDGVFDSSIIQTSTQNQANSAPFSVKCKDEFSSTDGSVEFTFNIDQEMMQKNNPVIEVVPHYLTSEDAKRVATVLLGNVDFFEQEPLFAPNYSKAQIQERINRWSRYTNSEAIAELYGNQADPTFIVEIVKGFIENYTEQYAFAPDSSQRLCEWVLKKDAYYFDAIEDIAKQDISDDNDAIKAVTKIGEVEYTFEVSTRDKSDFKINNIFLELYSGISPNDIDTRIYRSMLCRTQAPTDKDIDSVKVTAQEMLDKMDLGQWLVDECSVQTTYYGDIPEYIINVNAVPVIGGIPAIRRPQLGNLKSNASYASNYYLTDANFQFSVNGDLVGFRMYSPIDVADVLNGNVVTMSIDELMERAKSHLKLSDHYQYGMGTDYLETLQEVEGEDFICNIDISKMEYGMLRVKVPDTDTSYYYVPGIILSGSIDYVGKNTGTLYAASGETFYSERVVPLVALNAVDGSIIELYIN